MRKSLWPAILLCVSMLTGCTEPAREPAKSQDKPLETYAQAIDPVLAPAVSSPPVVAPVIIEDGAKQQIIYTCRYIRCELLKDLLDSSTSPLGTIQAAPQLNRLLINDDSTTAQILLKTATELDRPQPQLLVESRVLEITVDKNFEQDLRVWLSQTSMSSFWQASGLALGVLPTAPTDTSTGGQVTIRPLANGQEHLDAFIRCSPITYIKNIKTPTLIIQGENDTTDPVGQSQQFYRGAKRYGVDTELVLYPREPHGFREEKHMIDRDKRMLAWFMKYIPVNTP